MTSRSGNDSRVFMRTLVVLAAVYASLRYALPWLPVWIRVAEAPAPVPGFAIGMYMACAISGVLVYLSSAERRWREFLAPIVRTLVDPLGGAGRLRLLGLSLLPVLAGTVVWRQVMPRSQTPTALRVQHPGLPGAYAALKNTVYELPSEAQSAAQREGVVLYQKNCRPCHGAKADGTGPLARGLRLRPVDFTDPGTIATVVESYPYWRIEKGGPGLPGMATPWHSAMPAWKGELEVDDIWRIIVAEYRIAGTEPRKPEGAEQ